MRSRALASTVLSPRRQKELLRLQGPFPPLQTYERRQAVTVQVAKMPLLLITQYEVAGVLAAQLAALEK